MRLIIAILVLAFLWASPSFAQTEGNILRGAKTIYVSVLISPERGMKCSIKQEDIVSAYKFPFSNSNIVLHDNIFGSDLVLYLNIILMEVRQGQQGQTVIGCAFYVNFSVESYVIIRALPFNEKRSPFTSKIYEEDSIHTSTVSGFRKAIRDSIEEKSKKFITAYNLDNK